MDEDFKSLKTFHKRRKRTELPLKQRVQRSSFELRSLCGNFLQAN